MRDEDESAPRGPGDAPNPRPADPFMSPDGKDAFLTMVAHELRTPLSGMATAAAVLRLANEPGMQSLALDVIERQVRYMSELVEGLLDLSRLGRGAVPLHPRWVSVADLVRDAAEPYLLSAQSKEQQVLVGEVDPTLRVHCDPLRMRQALSNLIGNAVKYSPPRGLVVVEVRGEAQQVRFSVTDSGRGLAEKDLDGVFDLYTQVEGSSHAGSLGLGIGLALVRHLVLLHGGRVWVHSPGLDRGCVFTIVLPRPGTDTALTPSA